MKRINIIVDIPSLNLIKEKVFVDLIEGIYSGYGANYGMKYGINF
jgi:hypothetical protein